MYVRNSVGFTFTFKYRDVVITIPYDGKIYSIPDDVEIEKYNQLKVVIPWNIRTQDVTYIRKDGQIASENLLGHKRRGRPAYEEHEPKINEKEVKNSDIFIVDVDLDNLGDDNKQPPKPIKPKRMVRGKPRKKKP